MIGRLLRTALALLAVAGCTSPEPPPRNAADASSPDPCVDFTEAGAPCTTVSAVACFPPCASAGCFCIEGTYGAAPRWSCQVDPACLPDGSPGDAAGGDAADGGATDEDASEVIDASDAADAHDGA